MIALVGWVALSDGLSDRNGKPIGTDFSSFYAAGSLVLDGRAGDVYNMAAHHAREQQIFGPATPYYGWLYPPIFLLLAALASPHVLDYDLVVLAIAIAFFVRHGITTGFRNFEISLLAAAWIVPLLSRALQESPASPSVSWCCWRCMFSSCGARCPIVNTSAWRPAATESRKRDLICWAVLG